MELAEFLLVNTRANRESKSKFEYTPLMKACYSNHLSIVQLLVEKGHVKLDLSMSNGTTALYIACQRGIHSTSNTIRDNEQIWGYGADNNNSL